MPKVYKGENILKFDQYIDNQELLNFNLLLHSSRIILLIKIINKSYQIRCTETERKKYRAQTTLNEN